MRLWKKYMKKLFNKTSDCMCVIKTLSMLILNQLKRVIRGIKPSIKEIDGIS